MDRNLGWSSVLHQKDMVRKFRQRYMFTETAIQQDDNFCTEKSVANVAFVTRSKVKSPPTRSSASCYSTVKLPLMGKISSSGQSQGKQHLPSNLAGRDSLLEQTVVPKPKEIPVKAVPMKGIPVKVVPMKIPDKDMPYKHTIFLQKLLQKLQIPFLLKNGSGDL